MYHRITILHQTIAHIISHQYALRKDLIYNKRSHQTVSILHIYLTFCLAPLGWRDLLGLYFLYFLCLPKPLLLLFRLVIVIIFICMCVYIYAYVCERW
jgi:hypothetical protein